MTLEQAKQELIKRYRYLYENSYFILAPYVQEVCEKEENQLLQKSIVRLNINIFDDINRLFEEFLLSDKPMEESTLYQFIEEKRTDKVYLDKVKNGLKLIEITNLGTNDTLLKIDIWKVFEIVTNYVEAQSGDLINKGLKLYVIDQYYKILRYNNDGRVYTRGRHLTTNANTQSKTNIPCRDEKDIGVEKNSFISTIAYAPTHVKNLSIFSEKAKQKIYLLYHDELPCDLQMYCTLEEESSTELEPNMRRPENTSPCKAHFIIKEEEIFINPNERPYKYYQLCPYCGYIVTVPTEILSEGIKHRIEERCTQDDNLFKKMYLHSETFDLEKTSQKEQTKVLTHKKL